MGLRATFAFTLLVACLSAYATAPDKVWECGKGRSTSAIGPMQLKLQEVIDLASRAASKRGVDMKQYRYDTTCFDPQRAEWYVFFDGIVLQPWKHFGVIVNDKTKSTQFMPGQ